MTKVPSQVGVDLTGFYLLFSFEVLSYSTQRNKLLLKSVTVPEARYVHTFSH